ncbi:MAG TPA: carbamoyltransferase HypF [Holophagaceae bacterium]|nr:carbamoyltransferase HypF [Holophagaceae bacterium]
MPRLRLEVQGVIQGVGFRPFVYRIALAHRLEGWVRNRPDGVEIEVQGDRADLEGFVGALRTEPPPPAHIQGLATLEIPERSAGAPFTIRASGESAGTRPSVPADLALCPACRAEVDTPGERRHRYPFTNCTACGPRYSFIGSLPYDRSRTSMAGYPLCEACRAQYLDPLDRRFHAQPIACPRCGPQVAFAKGDAAPHCTGEAALEAAAACLRAGGILALKGVGGFQLLTDAASRTSVRRLRARKHRAAKPFAVMFPSPAHLQRCCAVTDTELALLQGSAAPILLLPKAGLPLAEGVAPGQPRLGAFLPTSPLHHLLLGLVDRPLVCTSGNRAEEPICIDDAEARARLKGIADAFLLHDRPILRPVDDSVGFVDGGGLRLLRRARGFAPLPLSVAPGGPCTLALGGHLKATLALLAEGQAVVSQHLGDLDSPAVQALLERTVDDLLAFFRAKPTRLACDLHPDYASTRLAERWAARLGVPLLRVQHHHAHLAACMAERGLQGPVLGLAWDGSGYGPDGTVWGGEALAVTGPAFLRLGHLRPFPLPGGDRAVREPRRSALGLCWEVLGDPAPALAMFTRAERGPLRTMLERGVNAPRTSSIGRLFDAVAALLGLHPTAGFEGQAAMALEAAAAEAPFSGAYSFTLKGGVADPAPLLHALLEDRRRGVAVPVLAWRFHAALAQLAVDFARLGGYGDVVLGGGCFQNRLLAEACEGRLRAAGYRVHRPALFPPNDGGLSLGQAWVAAQMEV